MLTFKQFFIESSADEDDGKLKHLEHLEDRPLISGYSGFEHAKTALLAAHHHIINGLSNNNLTMKYDGSPSLVFGHHPETGRFFVASKSAFNKNPKINYTPEDIETNHGHAPGLVEKLKMALQHLPKVTPKTGVYQGDVMFTHGDVKQTKDSASFKPNTITYKATGSIADKVKRAMIGLVVHTKYHGNSLNDMRSHHDVNDSEFSLHPDVHLHTANYDASMAHYPPDVQEQFHKHLNAAEAIHSTFGSKMYDATSMHHGKTHLITYINKTVRDNSVPSVEGLKQHIVDQQAKEAAKVKTDVSKQKKIGEGQRQIDNIDSNKEHYQNLLSMHHHLQQAKNSLVGALEHHEGNYQHSINDLPTKPEGFVIHHEAGSDKLVNRNEFARQNFLRSRG